jgi:hypothetical protein
MTKIFSGALAAAVIVLTAGAAHAAKNVCQWTGSVWACGDGNIFPEHYSPGAGPNMPIQPAPTAVSPSGQPLPVQYARPE